jgi:hypothetical protein
MALIFTARHFARSISRMSPWCTVATCPLSQAMVTPAQFVSVTTPPSPASPRQQRRLPVWRFLDSAVVKGASLRIFRVHQHGARLRQICKREFHRPTKPPPNPRTHCKIARSAHPTLSCSVACCTRTANGSWDTFAAGGGNWPYFIDGHGPNSIPAQWPNEFWESAAISALVAVRLTLTCKPHSQLRPSATIKLRHDRLSTIFRTKPLLSAYESQG